MINCIKAMTQTHTNGENNLIHIKGKNNQTHTNGEKNKQLNSHKLERNFIEKRQKF